VQMQAPPPAPPPPPAGMPQVVIVRQPVVYGGTSVWAGYWVRLAIVFVIVFLSGGGFWFRHWRRSMMADMGSAAGFGWDGRNPFMCTGNDQIDVSGINASFSAGSAVTVSGNCHMTCRDCTLRAPIAVEVDGNGQVTLVNGTITGTDTSLVASGNGSINVTGNAHVTGPYRQSANGKVLGVNLPPMHPGIVAAPPPAAPPPPHVLPPMHPGMVPPHPVPPPPHHP
jgi:hypothetical protein